MAIVLEDMQPYHFQLQDAGADTLQITNNSKHIITITSEGIIEVAEDATPTEAARLFIEFLQLQIRPQCKCETKCEKTGEPLE